MTGSAAPCSDSAPAAPIGEGGHFEAIVAAIVEASPTAIVLVDRSCRITLVNRKAVELFGFERSELLGQSIETLIPVARRVSHAHDVAAFFDRPESRLLGTGRELYGLRKDGTELPIEIGLDAIETGLGRFVLASIIDINARRRGAAERRFDTPEPELEDMRILEASRATSAFLAIMSHELRTPLNAIIGFAELIVDRKVDPASAAHDKFVGHILQGGRHLLGLVNDLLDLARVESGKVEFEPVPTALAPLVRDIVDSAQDAFAGKQVHVDVHVDEAPIEVWTDPGRLRQVLCTYLSNALGVVSPGGHVAVRAGAVDERWFRIDVEDTGPGISAHDAARLFTDFQPLRSRAGEFQSGTGIGLALTKRLVEAQGGSVAVSSEVGRGSVFSAILPRLRDMKEGP
jgi:protein-histidine pros-kinase